MTSPASTYRVSVAGGLRVAAGPLAIVAANVATLLRVRVMATSTGTGLSIVHIGDEQRSLVRLYEEAQSSATWP